MGRALPDTDTWSGHVVRTRGEDTWRGQPRDQCVRRTVEDGQTSPGTRGGVMLGKVSFYTRWGKGGLINGAWKTTYSHRGKQGKSLLTLSQK